MEKTNQHTKEVKLSNMAEFYDIFSNKTLSTKIVASKCILNHVYYRSSQQNMLSVTQICQCNKTPKHQSNTVILVELKV